MTTGPSSQLADVDARVLQLLLACEAGEDHGLFDDEVHVSSNESVVTVVSDFHLGGGARADGGYRASECFFWDDAFARFLTERRSGDPVPGGRLLAIAGDFVDFVRIDRVPSKAEEGLWTHILQRLGLSTDVTEVSLRERRYGLKTTEQKSVWKLASCVGGHRELFGALADWVAAGNRLLIVRGDHDLEWGWLGVRNYFRLVLGQLLVERHRTRFPTEVEAVDHVIGRVWFGGERARIDGDVWIEHGHRFNPATRVTGRERIRDGKELNLPYGAFIERYVMTRLEFRYPYVDSVRPRSDVLPLLVRDRWPLAMRMLFHLVPTAIWNLPVRYTRFIAGRILGYAAVVGLSLGGFALLLAAQLADWVSPAPGAEIDIVTRALGLGASVVVLILGYAIARMMAEWHLRPPSTLERPGRELLGLADGLEIGEETPRVVVMGHTHIPWQYEELDRLYLNAGSWMLSFDTLTPGLRTDSSFSFVEVSPKGAAGPEKPRAVLRRWNDEAGSIQRVVTTRRVG